MSSDEAPIVQGLPPVPRELTQEQRDKIAELQAEIEQIWTKKGNYVIDDEAWRTMPAFMEKVTEEDVTTNPACAALSSIIYDEMPAAEIAEDMKKKGNSNLQLALKPEQVNKDNICRSAVHFYTEGLDAKCGDRKLNATLFANRAQAHLMMQNYGHGLEDSQRAILLDRGYIKAYFRAAKCAMHIRRYDVALRFLQQAQTPEIAEAALGAGATSLDAAQLAEVAALQAEVESRRDREAEVERGQRLKARASAAESGNLVRELQSHGVRVGSRPEVASEQWAQFGKPKPFFDSDGLLHVPFLLLWDEHSQSDFLQDVPCDASFEDVLAEVLPLPWDSEGRYNVDSSELLTLFKIDDGVKMPVYYRFDPSWPMLEVMRCKEYLMPTLLPTFHVLPRDSHYASEWTIQDVEK